MWLSSETITTIITKYINILKSPGMLSLKGGTITTTFWHLLTVKIDEIKRSYMKRGQVFCGDSLKFTNTQPQIKNKTKTKHKPPQEMKVLLPIQNKTLGT